MVETMTEELGERVGVLLAVMWAEKRKRSRYGRGRNKRIFKKNRDWSGGRIRGLELGKTVWSKPVRTADVSGNPIMVRSVAGHRYRKWMKTPTTVISREMILDEQGGPGRVLESEVGSIPGSTRKSSHLLLEILHISDVLKLSEDTKIMIALFLQYLDKEYNYEWKTNSSLQAFQISVCWVAVSFLKQEIDRKESLATVKVQLDFICEEGEANYIYSELQNLDEGFKGYLKTVEPIDLEVGEMMTRVDEAEVSERTACYEQDLEDREAQLSSNNSCKSKSLPSEQVGRYLKRCFESRCLSDQPAGMEEAERPMISNCAMNSRSNTICGENLEEEVMSMSSIRRKRSKRSRVVEQACEEELPSSEDQSLSAQLMTSEGGVTLVGISDRQYQEEVEILLDSNGTNTSKMVTPALQDLDEGEIIEEECEGELPSCSANQILSAQLMTSEGGVTPVGASDWQYQEEGEILLDSNGTKKSKMVTPALQDLEEGEIVEQECEEELPNCSANQILSAQLMTSEGGGTPVGTSVRKYQEEGEILLDSNGTQKSKMVTPVLEDLEEGEIPIGSESHSLSDRVVNSEEGEKAISFQRAVTLEQELWSIKSGGSIKMKMDDVRCQIELHEKNLKTAAPRIVEKQLEASITVQLKKTLDKPIVSPERLQLSDTELKENNMLPTDAKEVHIDSDDASQIFSSPTNQNHCATLPTTPSATPVISPHAETITVESNSECKTMEATIAKEVTDSCSNQVGEASSSTHGLELGFPPSVSVVKQSPAESVHIAETIIVGSNTDCDTMETTITKKVADSCSKKTGEVSSSTPDPELDFPPPVPVVKQSPTVNEYIAQTSIVASNTECDTMEATVTKTVVDSCSNKTGEVSNSTLGPEHCFPASVPVVTQSPVQNVHIIESSMKDSDALLTQPNEVAFVDDANDQQAPLDEVVFIGSNTMPIQNKAMTSQRASISDAVQDSRTVTPVDHEPHSLECSVTCSSLVHQDMSAVQGESCPFQQLPISTVPLTAEQRSHVEPQFISSGQTQSSSQETQIPRHVSFEDSTESRMPCTAQGSLQPVTNIREGGNETFVQNASSRMNVQDFRNAANRLRSPNGHLLYSFVRPEIPQHNSSDPLQIEMQRIANDAEKDHKAHQDLVLQMTSERDEEIRKVLQKYSPLIQGAEIAKQQRKKEHTANLLKVYSHKSLAEVMMMNVNLHMAELAKWKELTSLPSVYATAIHGSPMVTCMPRNLQIGNELRAVSPAPAPHVLQTAFRPHSSALARNHRSLSTWTPSHMTPINRSSDNLQA